MGYTYSMSSPAMPAPPVSWARPTIEVTGEGTVTAVPNRAVIVLGVRTEDPSLSAAQSENASASTNVIQGLRGLNIPRERIQTVQYTIEAVYDFEDRKQTLRGYRVTHLLQITIDRVEQTGLVVDTAVNSGANIVSSIRFAIANRDVYVNQALSAAVRNAQNKAGAIAGTLGVTLIRTPVKITEEFRADEPPVPFQTSFLAEGAAVPTPIQPGELQIRAAVRAVYTYQ